MHSGGSVGTRLIFSGVPDLVIGAGLFAALGASMELRAQALTEADDADRARVLLEEGRAAYRNGDQFAALRAFSQASALQPADRDTRQAIADVLIELNAPQAAARALAPEVDIGIRSRKAAALVRWGEQIDPIDPAQRFVVTDAAIVELEALIAEAKRAKVPDTGLLTRLQRDLVIALRNRERWSDVLVLADVLRSEGEPVPPYVRLAEADALLAQRRPAEACRTYQDVLDAVPQSRQARIGRFYAEVEMEDFDAAFATVDALAAEGNAWRVTGIRTVPEPNHEWLEAQILAAQARRFADMPADAWRRLKPLADAAPAAAYLRLDLGETAASRGWPRLGHEEILIASSLAPDDITIQLALADSELRRRQWRSAQARLEALERIISGDQRVQRLRSELDAYRMGEFRMGIAPRIASGGGPEASGDGLTASMRAYSPPLAERWRVLAAAERETSQPIDETLVRNRYGVGIEGRWPDVTLELVAWTNTGLLSRGGADASLQWQPDDHWSLDFGLQAFSGDTPLRAIEAGVHADAATFGAVYAWNESKVASVGLQWLDFSDGNRRLQLAADFVAAIVDEPGLDVFLRPALYASRNSLLDAPYFNPRHDVSLSLALDVRHVLWRAYERSLVQRLVLNAGGYRQAGYDPGAVGSMAYEQTFRIDRRTEWNYGLEWSRRLYDGEAERSLTAFVQLNQRF